MALSRFLWLFIPYTVLVATAMFLWRGREADVARACVVIFTGSFVIGTFLATCWLMLNMPPAAGAALTGLVIRRILLITGGLAAHALVFLVWAIRRLEPTVRNRAGTWLVAPAIVFALCSPIPQARFWAKIYNPQTLRAAQQWRRATAAATDQFTADWAENDPASWQPLLLRANALYDAGRTAEAEAVDRQILELPAQNLPAGLAAFLRARLDRPAR